MFSMVVFVEVTNLESDSVDTDDAGTGVGMGFFLLVGLAFFGILFVLTSFQSSGIVYKRKLIVLLPECPNKVWDWNLE